MASEDIKSVAKTAGIIASVIAVAALLKNKFKTPIPPKSIPTELLLIGSKYREGLSSIDIASKIIERKKEIGIGIGPLPSGAENIDLQMEVIRVEVIVDALITTAKVQVALPNIAVTTQGINQGGLLVGTGYSNKAEDAFGGMT